MPMPLVLQLAVSKESSDQGLSTRDTGSVLDLFVLSGDTLHQKAPDHDSPFRALKGSKIGLLCTRMYRHWF